MKESQFRVGYYYGEKEGTIAIDLNDLSTMLNTGYGYHEITPSRSSGSVSIIRRKTAPTC